MRRAIATVGSWTLGPAPGANTLRATAGSISINITATAVTGPPSAISIQSGNNQTWVQGSLLPAIPSVRRDGRPVPGVAGAHVTVRGGGRRRQSSSGANQTTGSDGIATVGGWRLGGTATNTLTATVRPVITPVTFTAIAEPLVITGGHQGRGRQPDRFRRQLRRPEAHRRGAEPVRPADRGRSGHLQRLRWHHLHGGHGDGAERPGAATVVAVWRGRPTDDHRDRRRGDTGDLHGHRPGGADLGLSRSTSAIRS